VQGKQTFQCGDRVVNCVSGGPVPLAARGTVVAVEEPFVDLVLDAKTVSGNTLGGRCSDFRGYRVKMEALLNLSDKPGRSSKKAPAPAGWQASQQVKDVGRGAAFAGGPRGGGGGRGGRGGGAGRGGLGRGGPGMGGATFTGYQAGQGGAGGVQNGGGSAAGAGVPGGYQPNPQQLAMAMKLMQQQQQAGAGASGFVDPAIVASGAAPLGSAPGAQGPVGGYPAPMPPMGGAPLLPAQGQEPQGLMRMLQRANISIDSHSALPVPPRGGMPGMPPPGAFGGLAGGGGGMMMPPPTGFPARMMPQQGAGSGLDPAVIAQGGSAPLPHVDPAILTSGGPMGGGAAAPRGRGNARAAARAAYASGARGGGRAAPGALSTSPASRQRSSFVFRLRCP
jgi:hypothetical protein